MRVLVDQQLVPHAVSRTVIVIQPHLPQRATRKRIQLMPLSPGRELQGNERQKASQHGGVVQALLRIDFPPRQRTRGIGGAVNILAAGIVQVKMVMADRLIAGLARVIVAHRRIARRGGDGCKTLLDEPGLLLTKRKLLRLRVQLGERLSCRLAPRHFTAQPGEEVDPRGPVLVMALAIACQLDRIFSRFHQGDGVSPPDNFSPWLNGEAQGHRRGIGINHHPFAFSNLLAAFNKGILRGNGERTAHTVRQCAELIVVNKPLNATITAEQGEGKRNRAKGDI
ncbi:Uncharacterised protein [Enterobacter asburiae]|nr:Uncharacterised protein [Enterobacter asburiae]